MRVRCPNSQCHVMQDVELDPYCRFVRCVGCHRQFYVESHANPNAMSLSSEQPRPDLSVSLVAGRETSGGNYATATRGFSLHVKCPVCDAAVGLAEQGTLSDRTCDACESTFSIIAVPSASDVNQSRVPTRIARFEVQRQLGTGAFGNVWLAKDPALDRLVALKVPRERFSDAGHRGLFLREARAAAKLRHEYIVQVYEVGEDQGSVYIATEFIPGQTLGAHLKRVLPTPREFATITQKIAEAIHYAHEGGIIHRDLKPSNILIDESGKPFVADFGLARQLSVEGSTIAGGLIGTPTYMAPEQARGEGYGADARTDVYSLGVLLYEGLTGQPPFRGTLSALLNKILHEAPEPLRKLNPQLPASLETICLKCLEKDAARRYQTAGELAEDIRRYLQGQDISARAPSRARRAWKLTKQHNVVATAAAALVMVSLLSTMLVVRQWLAVETPLPEGDRVNRELAALADPQNLQSRVPAIKIAAEIAASEAQAKSKVQAAQYLARIGWGSGYENIRESLLSAFEDLTEEVRFATLRAISPYYGMDRDHPTDSEIDAKLRELASGKRANGDFIESSARVRDLAATIVAKHPVPARAPGTLTPSSPTPTPTAPTRIPPTNVVEPQKPSAPATPGDVEDLFKPAPAASPQPEVQDLFTEPEPAKGYQRKLP